MINLKNEHFFAQGDNQKCYMHPDNSNLCIKVLRDDIDKKVHNREISYYKLLDKQDISWKHIARLYSVVDTNFGRGTVFEFVRDFDNEVSKTLDYYFMKNDELSLELAKNVEELKKYLYDEAIVFRDLITKNIVVKFETKNTYKLVIVDGLGHNDFFPFIKYSKKLARGKITRQWNRKRSKWFDEYENIKGIITDI